MSILQSINIIKSGHGQKGPWNLVKATFDGKEYTGFVYDSIPSVGEDVAVEFFQEEYKGQMQDKFKLASKKAQQDKVTEMAINTHTTRCFQALDRKLDLIMAEMGIKDHKQEVENIRNQEVPPPAFEGDDVKPEDIPF